MKIRSYLILTLIIVLAAANLSATIPQEKETSAIYTGNGYLLVCNWPSLYFTVEVRGKNVKPLNQSSDVFLNVDGIIFQVQAAPISDFLKDTKDQKRTDQAILAAHRDWESDYIGSSLGKKLKVESTPQKLPNGNDALLWKFAMPEGLNSDAKTQMYFTLVSGRLVILLNGVVQKSMEESTVQKYLTDTAATIKISSEPIDVKKLADAIKKGNPG